MDNRETGTEMTRGCRSSSIVATLCNWCKPTGDAFMGPPATYLTVSGMTNWLLKIHCGGAWGLFRRSIIH